MRSSQARTTAQHSRAVMPNVSARFRTQQTPPIVRSADAIVLSSAAGPGKDHHSASITRARAMIKSETARKETARKYGRRAAASRTEEERRMARLKRKRKHAPMRESAPKATCVV